jgi:hypothetical protein
MPSQSTAQALWLVERPLDASSLQGLRVRDAFSAKDSLTVHTRAQVVICGASTGIGESLALRYAAAGARVVIMARRRPQLEQVCACTRAPFGQSTAPAETEPNACESRRFARGHWRSPAHTP